MATDWRNDAACKDAPTEWFFPEDGKPFDPSRGLEHCARCPVIDECAQEAMTLIPILDHTLHYHCGIWGGEYLAARPPAPTPTKILEYFMRHGSQHHIKVTTRRIATDLMMNIETIHENIRKLKADGTIKEHTGLRGWHGDHSRVFEVIHNPEKTSDAQHKCHQSDELATWLVS